MQRTLQVIGCILMLITPVLAQAPRLWVLRVPGELVEYDSSTFAAKQTVKVPVEALLSPAGLSINRLEQILFEPVIALPLAEEDATAARKIWLWNGRDASTIDLGVKRGVDTIGSNQAVTESAPTVYLSADGTHLYWFANQARRLQRENVDLSVTNSWQAWRTDMLGASREDLATLKMPDCRCQTGSCEESCPYGVVWAPEGGVDNFFLMTQFIAGQTETTYKASTLYRNDGGKWPPHPFDDPLHRVLDAVQGEAIIEAIPDTGCCGWSNQSNDQTLAHLGDKLLTVFDERATYKNPDYDVSFFTSNAKLSPQLGYVAMTITSTTEANKPIQLAEDGQANPEESQRIRKALADLPAVEIKSLEATPKRIAFLPHTTLIGWIGEKELLIVEGGVLVSYNLSTEVRRKSTVRVESAAKVFLR